MSLIRDRLIDMLARDTRIALEVGWLQCRMLVVRGHIQKWLVFRLLLSASQFAIKSSGCDIPKTHVGIQSARLPSIRELFDIAGRWYLVIPTRNGEPPREPPLVAFFDRDSL